MGKIKKILVAYDGSPSSENAYLQAIEMAKKEKNWIKVLAVAPNYDGDLELIGVSNIDELISNQFTHDLLERAKKLAAEHEVKVLTNMAQGEPFESIVDVADDENCDVIIMGRKGKTKLERELMGSVTKRVIGNTTKEVLVFPDSSKLGWGRILLCVDSSVYSESAFKYALQLGKDYNSALTIMSVVETNDEFFANAPKAHEQIVLKTRDMLESYRNKAEAEGLTADTVLKEGIIYQEITQYAEEVNADVILMAPHSKKGIKKFLLGSVTERVIGLSTQPVLVTHYG